MRREVVSLLRALLHVLPGDQQFKIMGTGSEPEVTDIGKPCYPLCNSVISPFPFRGNLQFNDGKYST